MVMYFPIVSSIPLAVLADAVAQLTRLQEHGMVIAEVRLTGYQYNERSEMWTLHFGGLSVNVHLPN